MEDGEYPEEADAADGEEGYQGRRKGVAVAPEGAGEDFYYFFQYLKYSGKVDADNAVVDNFRVAGEEFKDRFCKESDGEAEDGCDGTSGEHGFLCDEEGTFEVPGAEALTYEGGGGLSESVDYGIYVDFNDEGSGRGGHDFRSQAVDGHLDDHIGDGKYHALKTGRKADTDDSSKRSAIKGKGQFERWDFFFSCNDDEEYGGVHCVGKDSRPYNTCNPPSHHDSCIVQRAIDDGGEHEGIERRLAVPYSTEERGFEVIKRKERQCDKVNVEVESGIIGYGRRDAHDRNEGLHGKFAYEGEESTYQEGKGNGGPHDVSHGFPIFGTYGLGHDDVGAHGKTEEKGNEDGYDRRIISHCRHGIGAYKVSQ